VSDSKLASEDGAAGAANSKNIEYLVGIDHLRAFAALLVVFYHGVQLIYGDTLLRRQLPPDPWARANNPLSALLIEGHTSVALFMVLSAFLFSYGAAKSEVAYWQFLKNRALRTYPLFLVFLVMGMGAFSGNVTLERVALTVLGMACFNNVTVNFGAFSGMFWSLSVEWQFYVAFPPLLRVLRPSPMKMVVPLLLLGLVMRWAALSFGTSVRDASYFTMLGRFDQFLIGMLAGLMMRRLPRHVLRWLLLPVSSLVLGSLWQYNR
jgi:peptidoglycan/LPS O-acetylase OafA/YrhL